MYKLVNGKLSKSSCKSVKKLMYLVFPWDADLNDLSQAIEVKEYDCDTPQLTLRFGDSGEDYDDDIDTVQDYITVLRYIDMEVK